KEILAGGGGVVILGSGFTGPTGVAVDVSGNVYVTDQTGIKKIPAGNGPVVTLIGNGSYYGLALNGHGFIYATSGSSSIIRIAVSGGSTTSVGTGLNNPR